MIRAREEQERSRFTYHYSVFQLELSRNLLFQRGTRMDEVYQKLIDRSRLSLNVDNLKTLFGLKHRPHQRVTRGCETELSKVVRKQGYDLTVFKVKWGNLVLKIYDKGARVLRVEVVAHNVKALRCGKVLEKLPVLLESMGGMLIRFLDTVQVAHIHFLDQGTYEQWSEPTTLGAKRLAGINLDNVRNRQVIESVVGLSTQPDGFTLAQLAEDMRARSGNASYGKRQAAYDLAKLRGKHLVVRRSKSRRYLAEPDGVRTMCAYTVLREQVIKSLLAGMRPHRGRAPKNLHPFDQHYINLRNELEKTLETLGLVV